jgi:hypothetical protein
MQTTSEMEEKKEWGRPPSQRQHNNTHVGRPDGRDQLEKLRGKAERRVKIDKTKAECDHKGATTRGRVKKKKKKKDKKKRRVACKREDKDDV